MFHQNDNGIQRLFTSTFQILFHGLKLIGSDEPHFTKEVYI